MQPAWTTAHPQLGARMAEESGSGKPLAGASSSCALSRRARAGLRRSVRFSRSQVKQDSMLGIVNMCLDPN